MDNQTVAKTILVIDDDHITSRVFMHCIQRLGHRALQAASGDIALQQLETERPDLVILDLHLPDTNGLTLLKTLRERPELATTPVVVVTGSPYPEIQQSLLKHGVKAFVIKPVDFARLRKIINACLN